MSYSTHSFSEEGKLMEEDSSGKIPELISGGEVVKVKEKVYAIGCRKAEEGTLQ